MSICFSSAASASGPCTAISPVVSLTFSTLASKALGLFLNPCHILGYVRGIYNKEELFSPRFIDKEIISDSTLVIQHHSIQDTTFVKRGDVI